MRQKTILTVLLSAALSLIGCNPFPRSPAPTAPPNTPLPPTVHATIPSTVPSPSPDTTPPTPPSTSTPTATRTTPVPGDEPEQGTTHHAPIPTPYDPPDAVALLHATTWAPDPDAVVGSFSPIYTWTLGGDTLIAYGFAGAQTSARCSGLTRLTRHAGAWELVEVGGRCRNYAADDAITGVYSFITDEFNSPQTVIFGDVLSAEVTAVSIEFAVGGTSAVADMERAGYWLMRLGHEAPARAIAVNEMGNLVQIMVFDQAQALLLEPVGATAP